MQITSSSSLKRFLPVGVLVVSVVNFSGCTPPQKHRSEKTVSSSARKTEPVAQGAKTPSLQAPPAKTDTDLIQGKALEVLQVEKYTYVHLQTETGKGYWVAGPKSKLKAGSRLSFRTNFSQDNFFSKNLNRSFDRLHFTQGFLIQ
ncbi:MAG: hypothetical protein VYA34_10020 [Myxococcota bacterium]|nr:hypothetical protein [Myxococcota bacterium]